MGWPEATPSGVHMAIDAGLAPLEAWRHGQHGAGTQVRGGDGRLQWHWPGAGVAAGARGVCAGAGGPAHRTHPGDGGSAPAGAWGALGGAGGGSLRARGRAHGGERAEGAPAGRRGAGEQRGLRPGRELRGAAGGAAGGDVGFERPGAHRAHPRAGAGDGGEEARVRAERGLVWRPSMPGPFMSVYYASKAYVLSFSTALHAELRGQGVTVRRCARGTPRRSSPRGRPSTTRPRLFSGPMGTSNARQVAEAGWRGLQRGKAVVIPGSATGSRGLVHAAGAAGAAAAHRRVHERERALRGAFHERGQTGGHGQAVPFVPGADAAVLRGGGRAGSLPVVPGHLAGRGRAPEVLLKDAVAAAGGGPERAPVRLLRAPDAHRAASRGRVGGDVRALPGPLPGRGRAGAPHLRDGGGRRRSAANVSPEQRFFFFYCVAAASASRSTRRATARAGCTARAAPPTRSRPPPRRSSR